ncbi:hypothetical protein Q0F99_19145 [Rathayibacter oskolensis]|uniref:hypothetical protein n=1 Tax=Rathayibacter oskolensis TaxID=1891671 RepID=UPI00265F33ED|nr:hypothetical protein [Rathayibacter oskolensis]WKK71457.1 hypothetical protein Q0F99_19145 [Rathayibacter oskolensis]
MAEKVLKEAKTDLMKKQLVGVLEVFEIWIDQINGAITRDDPDLASKALADFSARAYEAYALLNRTDPSLTDLIAEIKACADVASAARAELYKNVEYSVETRIGEPVQRLRVLVPQLGLATVNLKYDLENPT